MRCKGEQRGDGSFLGREKHQGVQPSAGKGGASSGGSGGSGGGSGSGGGGIVDCGSRAGHTSEGGGNGGEPPQPVIETAQGLEYEIDCIVAEWGKGRCK